MQPKSLIELSNEYNLTYEKVIEIFSWNKFKIKDKETFQINDNIFKGFIDNYNLSN